MENKIGYEFVNEEGENVKVEDEQNVFHLEGQNLSQEFSDIEQMNQVQLHERAEQIIEAIDKLQKELAKIKEKNVDSSSAIAA